GPASRKNRRMKKAAGRDCSRVEQTRHLPLTVPLDGPMDPIYLDYSASTPVVPAVWEAMRPYFRDKAANPASSHRAGQKARQALEDVREQIASLLDAYPDEVIFTSGA